MQLQTLYPFKYKKRSSNLFNLFRKKHLPFLFVILNYNLLNVLAYTVKYILTNKTITLLSLLPSPATSTQWLHYPLIMQPEEHLHIPLPVHLDLPPFQAASPQWLHIPLMMQLEEHFQKMFLVHTHLPPSQAASPQWLRGP
jgi:hypothetical protein